MGDEPFVAPIVDSTAVFKPDIFKGKVLFCTGSYMGPFQAVRANQKKYRNGRRRKWDMSEHDGSCGKFRLFEQLAVCNGL